MRVPVQETRFLDTNTRCQHLMPRSSTGLSKSRGLRSFQPESDGDFLVHISHMLCLDCHSTTVLLTRLPMRFTIHFLLHQHMSSLADTSLPFPLTGYTVLHFDLL